MRRLFKTHSPRMNMKPKQKLAHVAAPDWRTSRKTKSRTFGLKIDVPHYAPLVEDVLDCLEKDTLLVFDPTDRDALNYTFETDGTEVLNTGAKVPVSIREWLCVGCQSIERGSAPNANWYAFYTSNASTVLFPHDRVLTSLPVGPAALTGRIILTPKCFPKNDSEVEADSFRFAVAHELVHAFDFMRFTVSAFLNWPKFWHNVLSGGSCCDVADDHLEGKRLFLDDYGTQNELEMVAEFWPSYADKWFRALHKANPIKLKKSRPTTRKG